MESKQLKFPMPLAELLPHLTALSGKKAPRSTQDVSKSNKKIKTLKRKIKVKPCTIATTNAKTMAVTGNSSYKTAQPCTSTSVKNYNSSVNIDKTGSMPTVNPETPSNITQTPRGIAYQRTLLKYVRKLSTIEEKIEEFSEEQTLSEVSPSASTPVNEYRDAHEYSSDIQNTADYDDTIMSLDRTSTHSTYTNQSEESVISRLNKILDSLLKEETLILNSINMLDNVIQCLITIKETQLKLLEGTRNKRNKETESHNSANYNKKQGYSQCYFRRINGYRK